MLMSPLVCKAIFSNVAIPTNRRKRVPGSRKSFGRELFLWVNIRKKPRQIRRKCQRQLCSVSTGRSQCMPLVSANAKIPPRRPKSTIKLASTLRRPKNFSERRQYKGSRYIGMLQSWNGKYHQSQVQSLFMNKRICLTSSESGNSTARKTSSCCWILSEK